MKSRKLHEHRRRLSICLAGVLLGIVLTGFFSYPVHASAQDETHLLRAGYFAFDGYHEMDEDGNRSGYGYELLQMIARYENISYEYVGYEENWETMQQMLEDGEIDFVTSASKTPEREAKFDFTERSVGTNSTMLTIKAGNQEIVPGDYETYDGMKVGMLRSNSRNDSFDSYAVQHGFAYMPVYYENEAQLQEALANDEITAIVTSSFRTTENEWILDTFDEVPVYIITRKGDTATMALLNDALEKLDRYDTGWRLSLHAKYYGTESGEAVNLSQEERAYLESLAEEGTKLSVAVNPDRYPYSFLDEEGNLTGIMLDEFAEIAKRLDLDYEVLDTATRQEYVDLMKTGEVDICLDMHEDFSNAEKYGYKITDIYLEAPFSWVLLKDFSGEIHTMATVGASTAKSTKMDDERYSDIQYKYYDSFDDCLTALRDGEVDGYYTYTYNAEKIVFDDVHNDLKTRLSDGTSYFCIGVRQDISVELLDALNKGVASMTDDETEIITEKYVNLGRQPFSLTRLAYQYPLVVLLLIIALILVIGCVILTIRAHFFRVKADAALVKAESADRAKTTFLSNMSHDIRTPINGIMGMLEIAREHLDDTQRVAECLEKMQKAAKHLLSLINDVLVMSKIEAGTVSMEEKAFDLRVLMDACCSIVEGQNEKENLVFVRNVGPLAHPYVYGSELYLRRIMINILGNAVKYTPDGGTITLGVEETGFDNGLVSLRISVSDTGIGIKKEFLDQIFEPFTQEQNDARGDYHGTGLGMAISKRLAEQMNGTLGVVSSPGKGSTFTLEVAFKETEKPEELDLSEKEYHLEGIRILLAEDNELNREIAVSLLEQVGGLVTAVCDGTEAVKAYCEAPDQYDVILMDVMMAEMDGLEATRRIRSFEAEALKNPIPIIAMTANVFAEDVKACIDAGMNAHVGKPIDMKKLTEKIMTLTEKESKKGNAG